MDIFIYIIIFVSKVIENSLATLRLIVVANGKKFIGAALLFVVSLIWIAIASLVIVDIQRDPLKVFFFAFGSFVGSYVGSLVEEKMALGSNMLIAIIDDALGDKVIKTLRGNNFAVTALNGEGMDKARKILMIMVTRKQRKKAVNIIKLIDTSSMVIVENADTIVGGYSNRKN